MKKSVLTGINQIEIIDAPIPEIINDNDVLIRMVVVGVCGSDIHYYKTGRIGSQVVQYPFTVGHEGAGIVEAVGKAVDKVKPGDRIAVEPSIACGKCDQCLAGRPHTCRNNLFLGCPGQLEGNLAEFIIMPESQCILLEEHQSIDDGAVSEPLAIGLYAIKQANLRAYDSIGILGFGPIGMSVFQMVQSFGFDKIYISEKITRRGKIAAISGASWVGNPTVVDIVESISAIEPQLLDVVFECCGQQETLDTAIEIVKPGGKLVLIGIPEFDRWSFSADKARRKEITIINIRRQNHCTEEALEMLASGTIDGSLMITHRFNLNRIGDAFNLVANYHDGVMKAMIDF
jgi:L-iditol 2-dehydrogenase